MPETNYLLKTIAGIVLEKVHFRGVSGTPPCAAPSPSACHGFPGPGGRERQGTWKGYGYVHGHQAESAERRYGPGLVPAVERESRPTPLPPFRWSELSSESSNQSTPPLTGPETDARSTIPPGAALPA